MSVTIFEFIEPLYQQPILHVWAPRFNPCYRFLYVSGPLFLFGLSVVHVMPSLSSFALFSCGAMIKHFPFWLFPYSMCYCFTINLSYFCYPLPRSSMHSCSESFLFNEQIFYRFTLFALSVSTCFTGVALYEIFFILSDICISILWGAFVLPVIYSAIPIFSTYWLALFPGLPIAHL